MTDAMQVKEALQLRHDEISKWLGDNAPYVVADQKHLDENTPERAYWHYGYKAALSDVLALAPSPAALDPVTVEAIERQYFYTGEPGDHEAIKAAFRALIGHPAPTGDGK
jgi:hypothetical protein